jgi:hypothetical protein
MIYLFSLCIITKTKRAPTYILSYSKYGVSLIACMHGDGTSRFRHLVQIMHQAPHKLATLGLSDQG